MIYEAGYLMYGGRTREFSFPKVTIPSVTIGQPFPHHIPSPPENEDVSMLYLERLTGSTVSSPLDEAS